MRTNKTAQAINRAIAQLSNPMHLPRKLHTTFGYELTFMPSMFDRAYIKTKGTIKTWQYYSEYVCAQSRVMEQMAIYCNRTGRYNRFEHFKTDPMVVEVTTKPTNNGARLRNIVRDAFKYADMAELQPRAMCSKGGGAHLHVGLIGNNNDEKKAFAAAIQYEVFNNPWMAWAFANPLDESNANQIPNMRASVRTEERTTKLQQSRTVLNLEYNIRDTRGDAEYYVDSIAQYTKRLHNSDNWNNARMRKDLQDEIAGMNRYRSMYRLRCHKYENELLAMMVDDYAQHVIALHTQAIEEDKQRALNNNVAPVEDTRPVYGCEDWPRTAWKDVQTKTDKCYAAVHRSGYGTIEFRCFMMYEHHADHAKQITLANALVKRAMHMVTQQGPRMYRELTAPYLLRDMKYSEAKRAFRDWLTSLDIDPDYYREECVNIALRKRAIRAGKVSV